VLLEIGQQRKITETERFCTINTLDVWKAYLCKSRAFEMKQVKSKHRNRMADEALDDSRRLSTTGRLSKGR